MRETARGATDRYVPASLPSRVTATQAFIVVSFPALGCLLYIAAAMPVVDVFQLLAGCGSIGAGTTLAVSGRRRSVTAYIRRVLNATEK